MLNIVVNIRHHEDFKKYSRSKYIFVDSISFFSRILALGHLNTAANVYAYRFMNQDGVIQEGSEDENEHGTGRTLLRTHRENKTQNALVLASRWYVK